jgi:hypothetical protein
MRLENENQILDENFRKLVIKELSSPENLNRKREAVKRYEIYKDQVKKYVAEGLHAEGLKPETIQQMLNRAGNLSLCRKVVNKLARTYSGGVSRETFLPGSMESNEGSNTQISELARLMCFDEQMRKGDRYRELQKNMMFQVVPEAVTETDPETNVSLEKFKISLRTLLPWQYDVIEDYHDREKPRVVILSDYQDQLSVQHAASEAEAAIHRGGPTGFNRDGVDQIIADSPSDASKGDKIQIVWWSKNYHFTTNQEGQIIPDPENPKSENPIHKLPFVNNADDQDGQFWAIGGDDLIDGSVLVNKVITDMNFIAYTQGWGQLVVTGRNIQKRIVTGPNNAIVLDHDPSVGDPEPKVQVISSNPPLEAWMALVEQYIALLLTTNNLSPGNIAGKLDANQYPSGAALMIEQSEATDDISDKQKSYKDIERKLWEVAIAWHNEYLESQDLVQEFEEIGKIEPEIEIAVTFHDLKPVISEKEKLEAIKMRKDLGLNSEIELLRIDNPDLSEEEAVKRLATIKKEKLENMKAFGAPPGAPGETPPEEGEEKEPAEGEEKPNPFEKSA